MQVYREMTLSLARLLLASFMIAAGCMHFVATDRFAMIVPDYLPWPVLLVQLSGVAEIALGAGLLFERARWLAGTGLICLYFAVLPANIHMAIHQIQPLDFEIPTWALWLRIPIQLAFIYWAYAVSRR